MRLWDGSAPWVISRYQDQRTILSHPSVSADPRIPGYPHANPAERDIVESGDPVLWRNFQKMDDPEHQILRRILTREFTVKRVEELRPKVRDIVDEQIDEMLAGTMPAEFVHDFALAIPSLVICELLGVPYSERAVFQRCSEVITLSSVSTDDKTRAIEEFLAFVSSLVDVKERHPGDDLISRLIVDYVHPGKIRREDVAINGLLLLLAGHETTTNMIALGTLALLMHPEQSAMLREAGDPVLVAGAVEELLRYLNVVHVGRRRVATADIELGGKHIRAGDGIIVPDNIGNRDDHVFTRPDELLLSRDSRQHLAFGFGPHQCLGQPLARLELQTVFASLLSRVPTLELAIPFDELDFRGGMKVYGVHSMPVVW